MTFINFENRTAAESSNLGTVTRLRGDTLDLLVSIPLIRQLNLLILYVSLPHKQFSKRLKIHGFGFSLLSLLEEIVEC